MYKRWKVTCFQHLELCCIKLHQCILKVYHTPLNVLWHREASQVSLREFWQKGNCGDYVGIKAIVQNLTTSEKLLRGINLWFVISVPLCEHEYVTSWLIVLSNYCLNHSFQKCTLIWLSVFPLWFAETLLALGELFYLLPEAWMMTEIKGIQYLHAAFSLSVLLINCNPANCLNNKIPIIITYSVLNTKNTEILKIQKYLIVKCWWDTKTYGKDLFGVLCFNFKNIIFTKKCIFYQ